MLTLRTAWRRLCRHECPTTGSLRGTVAKVSDHHVGRCGARRAPPSRLALCARPAAGGRTKIDRTAGRARARPYGWPVAPSVGKSCCRLRAMSRSGSPSTVAPPDRLALWCSVGFRLRPRLTPWAFARSRPSLVVRRSNRARTRPYAESRITLNSNRIYCATGLRPGSLRPEVKASRTAGQKQQPTWFRKCGGYVIRD